VEEEVKLHAFTISALDRGEWLSSSPGRFILGERHPSTHCIRGWMGPRAGLDAVERRKEIPSLLLPGIETINKRV
jgi:hypothetical protein